MALSILANGVTQKILFYDAAPLINGARGHVRKSDVFLDFCYAGRAAEQVPIDLFTSFSCFIIRVPIGFASFTHRARAIAHKHCYAS